MSMSALSVIQALLLASFASALHVSLSQEVTPVQKVIGLLGQLSAQITEEGKAEAAEYDKFACFCKEQADEKQYAIEKSDEKITTLNAKITELDTEINELNSEITALGLRIGNLTLMEQNEASISAAAHAVYVTEADNLSFAINAATEAIAMLEATKDNMTGDTKLDFMEVQAKVLKALPTSVPQLLTLSKMAQDPHAYEFNSTSIIDLLQKLLATFKETKTDLDKSEMMRQAASDKKLLAYANEKSFKDKDKAEKEELVGAKTEAKSAAEGDRDTETNARNADQDFLGELQSQCESRATEWDQRSKARSDELTALSEATEALKTGVAPNYNANKDLAGFERKAIVKKKAIKPVTNLTVARQQEPVKPAANLTEAPPTLIQVAAHNVDRSAVAVTRRALTQLDAEAERLHSPMLTALAMKVEMQQDHFVKVRGLVQDLITKLENEATAEASSKSYCDSEMSTALANRDARQLDMERESTTIAEKQAEKAQLTEEIATLSQQIAELEKGLNEASTLRALEEANNQKTLADATAGKQAIDSAISLLEAYYSTLQISGANPAPAPAAAPGSDRSGMTVDDRAPELSYSGDYTGKTQASTGIIGLLQVIQSDFQRTIDAVTAEETTAATDHTTFETETNTAIASKNSDVTTKRTAVTAAEDAITTAKDELKGATELHETSVAELQRLQAMCVEGEESWEERAEQRQQEIAALRDALSILEQWQG